MKAGRVTIGHDESLSRRERKPFYTVDQQVDQISEPDETTAQLENRTVDKMDPSLKISRVKQKGGQET